MKPAAGDVSLVVILARLGFKLGLRLGFSCVDGAPRPGGGGPALGTNPALLTFKLTLDTGGPLPGGGGPDRVAPGIILVASNDSLGAPG